MLEVTAPRFELTMTNAHRSDFLLMMLADPPRFTPVI
jgi:hypothetical protein